MENHKVVDNLEAAIDLWEKGFNVIPLKSSNPPPTPEEPSDDFSIFKKPLLKWKKFQNKRLSLEELKKYFERMSFLNLGIITNGLVIIDADNQKAVGWCDKNLDTPVVSITAKGKHYYFLKPPEIKVFNSVDSALGIDLRATGGYVVAPPSIHGSGIHYRWSLGHSPSYSDIPALSIETLELITNLVDSNRLSVQKTLKILESKVLSKTSEDLILPVIVGQRNDHLARLTGSLLRKGMTKDEILEVTKNWNSKNLEPLAERERLKTVESIINTDDRNNLLKIYTGTSGDDYPKGTLKILEGQASRGERGLAELLLVAFKDRVLFNHDSNHWLRYENGVWVKDTISHITWEAQGLLVDIFSKSAQVSLAIEYRLQKKTIENTSELDELKKEINRFKKLRELFLKTKSRISLKKTIDHVLELLSTQREMGGGLLDFDQNPLLINLQNGYYDLEAKEFKPHEPQKRFQCQARFHYVPVAKPEKWVQFLQTIFEGDQERIGYVQKLIGISITGRSDFQAVLFCFGDGKNGKSTFVEALCRLFGDYFGKISSETLLAKGRYGSNASDYDMADLYGKRMVVGDELSRDRAFNEALLKNLTGGDMIRARQPREKFINFHPTHTLWMFGNHKPRVSGTDEGIWRRMKLIPFEYTIPQEDLRDQREIFKDFEKESPGIFNWVLEGYMKYQDEGAKEPDSVKNATLEYRQDSDTLGRFMDERCTKSNSRISTRDLYRAYSSWCTMNSERGQYFHQKGFTQALKNKGLSVSKGSSRMNFLNGYKLMEKEENMDF